MNLQAKLSIGAGTVLVAGGVALGFALSGGSTPSHGTQVVQQVDQTVSDSPSAVDTDSVAAPTPTDTITSSAPAPVTTEAPVTSPTPVQSTEDDVAHGNTEPAGSGLPPTPLPAPKPAFSTAYYGPGASPTS